jgi:hypothetical protein
MRVVAPAAAAIIASGPSPCVKWSKIVAVA